MGNVMITGANGGLGRAMAFRFAKDGYDLVLCIRKETTEFKDFIELLKGEFGIRVSICLFDMLDEEEMKRQVRSVIAKVKCVDVLINNAGIEHGNLFQMTSIEEMKNVFDVNYFSAVRLTQLVVRSMIKNKSGAIINIASVAGIDLDEGNCAYGASKAALIAFTKTAAKEVAKYGIRVNAVAPGLTNTRMAAEMKHDNGNLMVDRTALKRLAEPKEVAQTVFFLASDEASFVTGQVIRVDGGM